MPLLVDNSSRTGTLVAAINRILVLEGPTGLTMRRIAAVSGVGTSSIQHQLGSREHLIRVAAAQTGRARRRDVESRATAEGALALLPASSDHVLDARAWLAWQELWRCEDFLERWLAKVRAEERGLLAGILDFQLATDGLDSAIAMIDGLTVAVCAPTAPMRIDRARHLLARHLKLLGVDERRPPSPYVDLMRDVTPPLPHVSSW
jgi:AcrR family transcriptional regulator